MTTRGQATITVEDSENGILFNNRALAQAEKLMGKSVIGVADGFSKGTTGINDIAMLLQAGLEAYRRENRLKGRGVTSRDAFDLMDRAGFTACATAVMSAVAEALGYDPNDADSEEEEDPNI